VIGNDGGGGKEMVRSSGGRLMPAKVDKTVNTTL